MHSCKLTLSRSECHFNWVYIRWLGGMLLSSPPRFKSHLSHVHSSWVDCWFGLFVSWLLIVACSLFVSWLLTRTIHDSIADGAHKLPVQSHSHYKLKGVTNCIQRKKEWHDCNLYHQSPNKYPIIRLEQISYK